MDFSPAWMALQATITSFVARLPYVVLSLVVFTLFYLAAKGIRVLVRRITERRKRHRNLGMVLGRLAQALMVLIGLLVALVIVLPGFTPGDRQVVYERYQDVLRALEVCQTRSQAPPKGAGRSQLP